MCGALLCIYVAFLWMKLRAPQRELDNCALVRMYSSFVDVFGYVAEIWASLWMYTALLRIYWALFAIKYARAHELDNTRP